MIDAIFAFDLGLKIMASADKAQAIMNAIAEEAQAKWGEDWQAQTVRAYCDVETQETGETVKPVNRRKQIIRSFDEGAITLESLCRLAEAVGIEFELTVIERRTRKI
jgi:NTP pyrophosphatase (non-canonical NTP hydrolase)